MEWIQVWILVWVVCVITASILGFRKGTGASSFFFGLILGPLGVILVHISKGKRVACPFCDKLIYKASPVCPHCLQEITGTK
ncbi:MAG: hypothetical protein E2O81_03195 [Betaproteobacteria bacterium]|nr:MAG: hypothetical protein E2O81_03195 [Betaproteobacteria bacterium]TDI82433.1 MAG: hypothetical protein E2O80_02210 [Betaproteobacteria bacterium]